MAGENVFELGAELVAHLQQIAATLDKRSRIISLKTLNRSRLRIAAAGNRQLSLNLPWIVAIGIIAEEAIQ